MTYSYVCVTRACTVAHSTRICFYLHRDRVRRIDGASAVSIRFALRASLAVLEFPGNAGPLSIQLFFGVLAWLVEICV